MGAFASFLASVFSGIFGYLATSISKKVAFGGAVAATILLTTTAFYAAIKLLLVGFTYTITNPYIQMAIWSVIPSNLETCLTVMFAAEVAAFIYRHQIATIRALSGVN